MGRIPRVATPSTASAVARASIGTIRPSFVMVARLGDALERELGRFPTRYTCDLVGCRGCLPAAATDEYGDVKRAFQGVNTGEWVTSRYPKASKPRKEAPMSTDPMQEALQACSMHALLMLSSRALTRSGFGDVEILDRRSSAQKSRYGGHELSVLAYLGTLPAKGVVKVVREDVKIRNLDELAGTVIRTKADFGLLVTPHHISKPKAALQEGYRPLRLSVWDGKTLADVMKRSGIGLKEGAVDGEFFASLEELSEKILEFIGKERDGR